MNSLTNTIVEYLVKEIEANNWKIGDKIPSERELALTYEVSRNVIRESINILVEKGLVSKVPGKGNYVTKPTESSLIDKITCAIDMADISIAQVLDARKFIEVHVLLSYMDQFTTKQLTVLESLYEEMEKVKKNPINFSRADKEFHLYLTECSQNKILKLYLQILYNMTEIDIINDSADPYAAIQDSQKKHRKLLDAIKEKDKQGITCAIEEHLKPLYQFYL